MPQKTMEGPLDRAGSPLFNKIRAPRGPGLLRNLRLEDRWSAVCLTHCSEIETAVFWHAVAVAIAHREIHGSWHGSPSCWLVDGWRESQVL